MISLLLCIRKVSIPIIIKHLSFLLYFTLFDFVLPYFTLFYLILPHFTSFSVPRGSTRQDHGGIQDVWKRSSTPAVSKDLACIICIICIICMLQRLFFPITPPAWRLDPLDKSRVPR